MGRAPPQLGAEQRHRRAEDLEGRSSSRHVGQHPGQPGGKGPEAGHLGREPTRRTGVGELALEEQVPDVLERSPRRQVDGRVLAVMEEPLLAPDVAQCCLGRHDPLQPGGNLGPGLVGRAQAGHPHEVAQRHHAHELVVLDHRQVSVLVMGQAGPGGIDLFVGPEHVGVRRHPHLDGLDAGRRRRRRGAEQVALGQDAGHLAAFDDDDRTDAGVAHGVGGVGQRRPRLTGHRGGRHQVTDNGRHGLGSDPQAMGPSEGRTTTILLLRGRECKR